ncbi:MAG TPA: enoyl-CoA hydratase-related protein [Dehalococcoidia bacterium]|nr:enoyl-CoA hydratase-related protein [Dehalococcoidia bacterium]
MTFQTLRLDIEATIARLVLARPAGANRIDQRVLRELVDAAQLIAEDTSVALTVLSADGTDFCAGWDPDTRDALSSPESRVLDPFGCIANLPAPVLVALQGAVHGAGLELALACDIRIAADDAHFALPDVALGSLPLAGGSQRLPRVAGRSVATSMLLLGDELDAAAAYRAGIVSRVFPAASLAQEAETLARRIAANGPLGLRYAKEAVTNGLELPLDAALRLELDFSVILQTTRDRAEGVEAFKQKRPPQFEGR